MRSTSTRRSTCTRRRAIAALKAGKHVACTVPAATTVEECRARSCSRRDAAAEELHDDGNRDLHARIPLRPRAARYRQAGPHPVHARLPSAGDGRLARLLGRPAADALRHPRRQPLPGAGARRSGATSPASAPAASPTSSIAKYGSPFAVESALFKVRNQQIAFEVTRSLFETARQYIESFDVYGDKTVVRMDADRERAAGDSSSARSRSG